MLQKKYYHIIVLCWLAFMAIGAEAQTSTRIKQLQQQSANLKKQISASETLLKTTKKDVNTQLGNLALINAQITDQQKLVDGFQAEAAALSGDITVLEKELSVLKADLESCKRKYRRTVLYMNRNRLLSNRWMFVLMSKNFRQMYRRMRYAADYSKYLRVQGEAIKKKEAAVREKQASLHAAKRDKDALLSDARNQHAALEGQKAQRQGVINELNKKQSQLQASIKQQRRKQSQLDARIDQLIKQEIAAAEARRKKAEAARKAAEARRKKELEAKERAAARLKKERTSKKKNNASKAQPNKRNSTKETAVSRHEEEDATDRTVSAGFKANKGRLPVPITGSYAVTSRYGQYNVEGLSGVTLNSKGINLTGHRGAQARCVYNGEVSAVANLGGTYIVIVRHGSYYSVYSNLSSVSVRNGQNVNTRQVLGNVAADASGNCTLHFQLRQRSGSSASHINPLPWLAR